MSRTRFQPKSRQASTVRMIGGEWRGRRMPIANAPGLRPTPDRVRETLFNWLAPRIAGARCLDAFAGTGALGLEALSRGAAHVDFVDPSRDAIDAIRTALDKLGAHDRATLHRASALALPEPFSPYEIVFIDPPFAAQMHTAALAAVAGYMTANARLYLEYPAMENTEIETELSRNHTILHSKKAGSIGYCLAQPAPDSEDSAL